MLITGDNDEVGGKAGCLPAAYGLVFLVMRFGFIRGLVRNSIGKKGL